MDNKKTILIITGPTATGKSKFAIECAKMFNGEILSCDSMQIYKDLDIGTAKATKYEQKEVKHHLIDIVLPNKDFSVQQYINKAKGIIDDLLKKGKLPIIVGGTGLYIKSLIYPYSFCSSPKDESVRQKYQKILEENGKEYLFNLLKEKDVEASKTIHPNDTKRVIRALEICETSQNKKTNLNSLDQNNLVYNVILVVLNLNREVLYRKINLRVDQMFEQGLINEFDSCVKKYNLDSNSQSMQAIGYKELFNLNEVGIDKTIELIKQHTRNYAKRQITFFKGFKDLAKWFDVEYEKDLVFKYIKQKLDGEDK